MNLIEEIESISGSRVRQMVAECSPSAKGSAESRKLCVYNQTRECFLGLNVAAADLSYADLKDLIANLALKFGEGLWMAPFPGIPETGTLVPLDLVYLDEDCRVIDVVESFPTFRISPLSMRPASVLALPAHSIYSSQTQPGDRLLVCAAEDMEQHLERFTDSGGVADPVQSAVLLREKPLWSGGPGLLQLNDRSTEERAISERSHEMSLFEPGMKTVRPPWNWMERWWFPDPRKAPREPASDLAAYYWDGGVPQAHSIKDISSTGLYVVTEERWYPGTLILMTLQPADGGETGAERALSVHTRAVRWGNDGVGLQFILRNEENAINGQGPVIKGVDRQELDRFLRQLGKGK